MKKLIATLQSQNNTTNFSDENTAPIQQACANKQPRIHAFKIGDLGFLLNTEEITSEVCSDLSICRLPNTLDCLHGISNHRGNMVPIFNMEKILDIADTNHGVSSKYLLFGQRQQSVGILIHELPFRFHISKKDRLTNPPEIPKSLAPHINQCYQKNKQLWLEWDVFNFFLNVSKQIAV